MQAEEMKEYLRAQIVFHRRRSKTPDERSCYNWWIDQIEELSKRAPSPELAEEDNQGKEDAA